MGIQINKADLLRQELERVALVLHDADYDQYERAVLAVTEAINGLPDVLPDREYQPVLFRFVQHREAA